MPYYNGKAEQLNPWRKSLRHLTLPAHYHLFTLEWQSSTAEAHACKYYIRAYYDSSVHPFPGIKVGTNEAVQDPRKRLWDTCGTATAIDPLRQYHVKTKRRMLWLQIEDLSGAVFQVQCFWISELLKSAEKMGCNNRSFRVVNMARFTLLLKAVGNLAVN